MKDIFVTLTVVKILAGQTTQMDLIARPVNTKTSTIVIPQDSASTRIWCVTIILTLVVVGMMRVLISA